MTHHDDSDEVAGTTQRWRSLPQTAVATTMTAPRAPLYPTNAGARTVCLPLAGRIGWTGTPVRSELQQPQSQHMDKEGVGSRVAAVAVSTASTVWRGVVVQAEQASQGPQHPTAWNKPRTLV